MLSMDAFFLIFKLWYCYVYYVFSVIRLYLFEKNV